MTGSAHIHIAIALARLDRTYVRISHCDSHRIMNLHCRSLWLSPIDADVYSVQLVGYCCGVLQLGTEQNNMCVDTW